jgi:putative heme iron utilization protein
MQEPTLVERARELAGRRGIGVLATLSKRKPGYPFASLSPYAMDRENRIVFFFSRLAVHTRNLSENPRACLLVYEEGAEQAPLEKGRLHLTGEVQAAPDEESEELKEIYLQAHPEAGQWIEFGDFGFYRLTVEDVYFVGGFGEAGIISAGDWKA